jgi:uridylate kinase
MEHHMPIVVFDVAAPDAVYRALRGDTIGTLVSASPEPAAHS